MKSFFGGVFISQEMLKNAGINHPIRLEYYKRINEDELLKTSKAKYGISIVKTEYLKNKAKVEEKEIEYLTNDETQIEHILNILKENYVTPIGMDDVMNDFFSYRRCKFI